MSSSPDAVAWRATGVAIAALVIAGCAATVPTLWPFSSRTSDMSTGIRSGFAGTDTLLQLADTPPEDIARFRSIRSRATATLTAVVEYSRTLAEVAATGRAGKDAARTTAEALGGVVAIAGAPQAAGVTTATVAELAGAVAAVRARTSLKDAVETAQPAIDTIATILTRDLSELERLVAIAAVEAERKVFGEHYAALDYRRSLRREVRRTDEILTLYLDARAGSADAITTLRTLDPESPPAPADSKAFEQREQLWRSRARELDAELKRIEPDCRAHDTRMERIARTEATTAATLQAGRNAVTAWARAHRRIPEALDAGLPPSIVEFAAATREIAEAARKGTMP